MKTMNAIFGLMCIGVVLVCLPCIMGASISGSGSVNGISASEAALNASGLSVLLSYNGTSPEVAGAIHGLVDLLQNGSSVVQAAWNQALSQAIQSGKTGLRRLTLLMQIFQTQLESLAGQIPNQQEIAGSVSLVQGFIKSNLAQLQQYFNSALGMISGTETQFNNFVQVLQAGFQSILNSRPGFHISSTVNQLNGQLSSGKLNATISDILNKNPGLATSDLSFQQALQQLMNNGSAQVQQSSQRLFNFVNLLGRLPQLGISWFNDLLSLFNPVG